MSPQQLDLLYYASGSAIWLGDGSSAVDYSERFLAAVGDAATPIGERKKWSELAGSYLAQSRGLVERDASLARAESLLPLAAEKLAAETKRIAGIKSREALAPTWLDGALRAAGVLKEGESL
jgi:hypothetical protein